MSPYKRCFMILADGARPDVMARLLREGRLPQIERYLVQPGSFQHGVTAFPSTTGPAYLPFLTGCSPGTCNVPGIRWFDKEIFATKPWSRVKHRSYVGADTLKMNHDIAGEIQTLFQLIPSACNIFNGINRGVSFRGNRTGFMRIWNWYYAHLTDRWSLVDANATEHLLRCLERDPEFVFVVYPGVDEYSHMGDPEHAATMAAYGRIDEAIGELVQQLDHKGWLEESILLIVSDHGLTATHEHLGVNQLLEQNSIKTFYYPVVFKRGFRVAHMVSGNGMSHLYFANSQTDSVSRRDWRGRCYVEDMRPWQRDVLTLLDEQAAVDLVVVRSKAGGVLIQSGDKRARAFQDTDGMVCYERIQGDPLGYEGLPDRLSVEEWLQASHETDYPDALVQLLQLLRSPRAGDVILSARKGYDLRQRYEVPEHHGSHGSLHREHMLIPIISNVPMQGSTCRSVDVFPTVLEWLGRPIPDNIDGISRA